MLVPESSGKSPLLRHLSIMFWSGLGGHGVRPDWVSCNRTGVAVGRVYINIHAFLTVAGWPHRGFALTSPLVPNSRATTHSASQATRCVTGNHADTRSWSRNWVVTQC
jgi:hypothetical protein